MQAASGGVAQEKYRWPIRLVKVQFIVIVTTLVLYSIVVETVQLQTGNNSMCRQLFGNESAAVMSTSIINCVLLQNGDL